jgi:hypothetical protein
MKQTLDAQKKAGRKENIMRNRKCGLLLAGLMVLTLAAGCGGKTTPSSDTTQQSSQTAETQAPETGEQKTLSGTIDEIKDFMFVVTDESDASYEFSFETKPEGLDSVAAGDKVTVTYTGEISEVDPFNGTVLSVEKQQ